MPMIRHWASRFYVTFIQISLHCGAGFESVGVV